MMFISLVALGLVFGTVNNPFKFPKYVYEHTLNEDDELQITRKHVKHTYFVCCDTNSVHYFFYKDDTVRACTWGKWKEQNEQFANKLTVCKSLRAWYKDVTNRTLSANIEEPDDALVWSVSELM